MTRKPRRILQATLFIGFLLVAGVVKKAASADLPEGWTTDWKTATAKAKESNKPILAVFSAEWCGPCQAMKKEVYPEADVKKALEGWVPVYIDEKADRATMESFKVEAFPTFVVLSPEAKEEYRFVGGRPKEAFLETLSRYPRLRELKASLEKTPEDPKLWKELGTIREESDDTKGAIEAYEKASYYDPKDATGIADDLYLLKAIPESREGLKDSEVKLAAFEKKFPKSELIPRALFFRALVAADSDKVPEAIGFLKEGIARFPDGEFAERSKQALDYLQSAAARNGDAPKDAPAPEPEKPKS